MTAQEYIQATLEELAQPVAIEDIGHTPLEDAVFAKVMSKKFRKLKADETTTAMAKNAIHTAVTAKQPITVSFLFGGNKLWRFDEAPEIDWAELFAVSYFCAWVKSIASVYPHGARLDFYSEDVAVELLNNVPCSETERYSQTFRQMLDWLRPQLPQNITITYRRYGDEYATYDDYLRELEAGKVRVLERHGGKLPVLTDQQKRATELNVRLRPGQADDPLWREKTELIHQALEATDTMARYFNDPTLIMACPTNYSGWIAAGSTKHSYAKFWAGVGALRKSGTSFNELVLTPKQLAEAEFKWEDVHLPGLAGKNFSKIRVLG